MALHGCSRFPVELEVREGIEFQLLIESDRKSWLGNSMGIVDAWETVGEIGEEWGKTCRID